jgi:hypothetical protein
MSSSDKRSKASHDVATTSTSSNAIPGLQNVVGRAMTEASTRTGGPVHVGLVGPGAPEKGQSYSPQVRETVQTMLGRGGQRDVLHLYHYEPHARNNPAEATHDLMLDTRTGAQVRIEHHKFDVTDPDPADTHKNDVLIATRVMQPVLSSQPRNTLGTDRGPRKDTATALRDKAAADAHLLTDKGAVDILKTSHRDIFAGAAGNTFGGTPRHAASFSFGTADGESLKAPKDRRMVPPTAAAMPRAAAARSFAPVSAPAKKAEKRAPASPPPGSEVAARMKAYSATVRKPAVSAKKRPTE